MAFKFRQGLEANRTSVTPASGEPLFTIDSHMLYVGDGTTAGGNLIGGSTVAVQAGEALGGHRIVYKNNDGKVYYADCTEISHLNRILGLTVGAINSQANGVVLCFGLITEPSWTWTMGLSVYLSTSGLLTQTAPTSDFALIVGFPTATTSMFIDIQMPVMLA
jgi:hypothetical protein